MTKRQEKFGIFLFSLMVCSLLLWLFTSHARAEDCPPGAKSCKVMVLSPEEEQALVQPNGILATAAVGRKIDLEGIANYFFEKIKNAPAGKVVEPPKPVEKPAEKPAAPK